MLLKRFSDKLKFKFTEKANINEKILIKNKKNVIIDKIITSGLNLSGLLWPVKTWGLCRLLS